MIDIQTMTASRQATAFEARTHLGELMDHVRYSKQPCFIERHGKVVAALVDIQSFEEMARPQQYWTWVREAVALIVTHIQPEKIVLFGSLVRGEIKEGSDIDLLIVKDSPERNVDQVEQILRLLPPENPVEPHVLTPQELQNRLEQKDPFIRQALGHGLVLYEAQA